MDHSPSEQLEETSSWHTTVLVISSAFQHADLSHRLAEVINPRTGKLKKWNSASQAYKRYFVENFNLVFENAPVYIFAISATREAIIQSQDHFIQELKLKNHYHVFDFNGKRRVKLDPVIRASSGAEESVELSENRAAMGLFLVHFIRRVHGVMFEAVNFTKKLEQIHWHFFADRLPGNTDENYDLMFQYLLGRRDQIGELRWGYFKEGDTEPSDLLADNLAGLLSSFVRNSSDFGSSVILPLSGLMYWEQWRT